MKKGKDGGRRAVGAVMPGTRRRVYLHTLLFFTPTILFLNSCATRDTAHRVVISVPEQKLAILEKGEPIATYPVSTSKFGVGDYRGSWGTPLGKLEIVTKIGDGAPLGAVFKDRRFTGEILPIDAPGRDPIVTRILWLRGREPQNQNAYRRYIYIHGTPEERNIGLPVSYGCVRMRSSDIIQLYDIVGVGAEVTIVDNTLHSVVPEILPPGGIVARMKEPFAGALAR
jgi:lipoprotein-anchoring transpeptidase ErfK/SrfK